MEYGVGVVFLLAQERFAQTDSPLGPCVPTLVILAGCVAIALPSDFLVIFGEGSQLACCCRRPPIQHHISALILFAYPTLVSRPGSSGFPQSIRTLSSSNRGIMWNL